MKWISLTLLLALHICVVAQETPNEDQGVSLWHKAVALYDDEQYGAARETFQAYLNSSESLPLIRSNEAKFYIAVCSYQNDDPDSERLLNNIIDGNHETTQRKLAYYYLGSLFYEQKKYKETIIHLQQTSPGLLTNDQLLEHHFKLGYAYLIKKNFDEAQPLFRNVSGVTGKYYYPANYYFGFTAFYKAQYEDAMSAFKIAEQSELYKNVVPYYIAQIYFRQKNFEEVISYASPIVEEGKNHHQINLIHVVGQAYFNLQNYDKAVGYLSAYVENSKKVRSVDMYQLAYAEYQTADYESAIEHFQELDHLRDTLGESAMYALSDVYLKTGEKDKARSAFQKSASFGFNPEIKESSEFNYAKLSAELGYHREAIQSLKQFQEDYPRSIYHDESVELLAQALVTSKDYRSAIEVIESSGLSSPAINEAYQKVTYFRAVERFNDGKYDQAKELLEKSLSRATLVDFQADAHFLMGEVLYGKRNFKKAVENYNIFIQLATSKHPKRNLAYYNIAYCYFKQKQYDNAITHFEKTANAFKKGGLTGNESKLLYDAYLRAGDAYFMTKNYTAAVKKYDLNINKQTKHAPYALIQKATILGLQDRRQEKINTLNTLSSRYPKSKYIDDALFSTASTYQEMGNNQQALQKFEDLMSKYPRSQFARKAKLQAGLIYYNLGNAEKALATFKRVIQEHPKTVEAKEAIVVLEQIYIEVNRPEEFIAFMSATGDVLSTSVQDSIFFETGENAYLSNNCDEAITAFGKYLTKFPKGFFEQEARFFRADCLVRQNQHKAAITDYDVLRKNKSGKYYTKSLHKAAWIYYNELEDYASSMVLYEELLTQTYYDFDKREAYQSLLISGIETDNWDKVVQYARAILDAPESTESDLIQARFYLAKAAMNQGELDAAMRDFSTVVNLTNSALGAEAQYNIARIKYLQGDFDASLQQCFNTKNNYGSYEYWVVKAFILMAENYYRLDNSFQAKATLESIISNYTGDQALLDEAKRKLEAIQKLEEEKSRVQVESPSDTLEIDRSLN